MKTVRRPPYPKWNPGYFPCSSLTPLPLSSRRPSVSFGGFGLNSRMLLTDLLTSGLLVRRFSGRSRPNVDSGLASLLVWHLWCRQSSKATAT